MLQMAMVVAVVVAAVAFAADVCETLHAGLAETRVAHGTQNNCGAVEMAVALACPSAPAGTEDEHAASWDALACALAVAVVVVVAAGIAQAAVEAAAASASAADSFLFCDVACTTLNSSPIHEANRTWTDNMRRHWQLQRPQKNKLVYAILVVGMTLILFDLYDASSFTKHGLWTRGKHDA